MPTKPTIEYTVALIDPGLIKIPVFDYNKEKIRELAQMISISGMQNPPIIKDETLTIVAGRRRVLACILNEMSPIKVHTIPENTPPEICQVISLHENLGRENLSWYDQCIMQLELHKLRQDTLGVAKPGPNKRGWSLRDTADELGISLGSLSENIRLADAVLSDPTLKKIEDKATAKRIILTDIKRAAQEMSTSLPSNIATDQVYHGSSEVILTLYPDKTFDVCITDPPWLSYKDKKLVKDEFTDKVFKEVFKKLKDNSFLYMFVSTPDFTYYSEYLENIGFSVQKYPLIWIKEGVLSLGNLSWQYQRNYEPILLAVKGTPALTRNLLSAIYSTKVVPSMLMIHPNEKPKEIIKILLEHCTYENSLVLDPFGGSGVVAESCVEMGRKYITIERDPKFYTGIINRLGKHLIFKSEK